MKSVYLFFTEADFSGRCFGIGGGIELLVRLDELKTGGLCERGRGEPEWKQVSDDFCLM
jgi:hypothetical protein